MGRPVFDVLDQNFWQHMGRVEGALTALVYDTRKAGDVERSERASRVLREFDAAMNTLRVLCSELGEHEFIVQRRDIREGIADERRERRRDRTAFWVGEGEEAPPAPILNIRGRVHDYYGVPLEGEDESDCFDSGN